MPRNADGPLDLLAGGKVVPVVAERIPLGEPAHAHALLELGGCWGKVVLKTNELAGS